MNFPNLRGSVFDKMCHKNDTFQCIKPYDTPNGRSLRVVCHHCDLECVLISWLPRQQISPKICLKFKNSYILVSMATRNPCISPLHIPHLKATNLYFENRSSVEASDLPLP